MTAEGFIFWFLALVTMASALSVVMMSNPIYSALSLAMTMVGVSALFVTLNAFFIAGVQLIVYAGAVMVLFVMVLMLFDIKEELRHYSSGKVTGGLKLAAVGALGGLLVGAALVGGAAEQATETGKLIADPTKALGELLFTKYIFIFEALGVLLLVIAVGAVALARSRGGTHAKH